MQSTGRVPPPGGFVIQPSMLAAGVAKHGQEQPAAGKGGHLIESGEVVAPQEGRRTKVPEDLAVRPCRFPSLSDVPHHEDGVQFTRGLIDLT